MASLLALRPFCSWAAWMAMFVTSFSASVLASDRQVLLGHVPAAVFHSTVIGSLDASNRLNLAIGLPLRNKEGLTRLLQEIYDPRSPSYHHYLSPEQFTERFGPSEEDYKDVVAFAQSNGLTLTSRHSNRMLIEVNATVAEVERAFHVKLVLYRHPVEARTFYAPDVEPTLDLATPVLRIVGLNNYAVPRPASFKVNPGHNLGGIPNAHGSGPGGAYLGKDFRVAYAPGVSLAGAGQAMGLLEFDGYFAGDISSYETIAGLTNVSLTNVLLGSFNGDPGSENFEVALDIELAIAMAPELAQVIVYEGGPQGSADVILNRMATDDTAKQLISSWLWGGGDDALADQIFQEFAAQGQTFFIASGDNEAYSGTIPFPADNPFITVVGGTALATDQQGGWASETVWTMNGGLGTSGGISPTYLIPQWQEWINMGNNKGSIAYRNIPDVAMVANNVWVTYNNGQSGAFFGTSCATPLWGALTALVNQQAAAYGQAPVGFLNPALYAIAEGTNYRACFHDITTGNNTNSSSPSLFFAVDGYDLCTGLGSPAGQFLIDALASPPQSGVPIPGFQAVSQTGGAITFSWATSPGVNYQVQYRTNLAQGTWQNLGSAFTATSATLSASNSMGPDPQRFYRVLILP